MSFAKLACVAGIGLLTAMPAQAGQPAAPFRLSAAELEQMVAKTTDGLASAPLPTGEGGPVVVVARRLQTGEVEVHDAVNDVFVAKSGAATVLVGGKAEGQRQTGPGEWRGGKISGAASYPLAPGDVLWIPAGLPHLVVVTKGQAFTYMAFKSPK